VKYKLNRQKFGKAPMSILPALLACLEYDSSSPYFELVRCYMRPNTPEERWAVLEADVKEAYAKLEAAQNASFNQKIDRIVARLKRMELRGKSGWSFVEKAATDPIAPAGSLIPAPLAIPSRVR
jgi:hypothetical protein